MTYENGTCLNQRMPWGLFTGGRAVCPDGMVRRLARISQTADTAFSIPAGVQVRGVSVSGYVTSAETDDGKRFLEFRPYDYRKNADKVFPRKPFVTLTDLVVAAKYDSTATSTDVRFGS